jgi:DNA repair protein RadD
MFVAAATVAVNNQGQIMKLRDYQQEAVDAVFDYLERAPSTPERLASPLVVMPTGSGKSPTLGEIVRLLVECGARVVIATHRAELIVQDAKAVRSVYPGADLGIVSSGLGRKEWGHAITVGGVQTMARKTSRLGKVDFLIVDEAHLISTKTSTQYHAMIAALRAVNADMRLIGLTATPYRLGQGFLTEGEDALFTSVCYQTDIVRLIKAGWLAHITTGAATASINLDGISIRAGEYASNDLELASDVDKINDAVAADVAKALAAGRTSALVFGTSVAHAARLRNALRMAGVSTETITGATPREERDRLIAAFKARKLACITSCDVLTTGFDAPVVDVLALVRATMSPSLYVQMVGRGMRIAEGKTDCLLLDYAGNIARHGPIDDVRVKPKSKGGGDAPVKLCPNCQAMCATSARQCDHCGHMFPEPTRKANDRPSALPALSIDMPIKERPHFAIARERVGPEGEAICRLLVSSSAGMTMMEIRAALGFKDNEPADALRHAMTKLATTTKDHKNLIEATNTKGQERRWALSDDKRATARRHEIGRVEWSKHYKFGDDNAPPTLQIDYFAPGPLAVRAVVRQWVCLEHDEGGFAWRQADKWWALNVGTDTPATIDGAINVLDAGYLKPIDAVWTNKRGKWDEVEAIVHAEAREPGADDDDEEVKTPTVLPTPKYTTEETDDIPW